MRIVKACGDGIETELGLARIDNVRRTGAIEPVGCRARHRTLGGDAVENDIEKQRQPDLATDCCKLLDGSVSVAMRFQRGIGSFENVGEEDIPLPGGTEE